jgi:ATP-dependent DNA helicase UvrD/PcrA
VTIIPTPEQQAIIDHPLQPLRIAAGAGTGKTTTIVLRLAALIEAGLQPEEALGITFTNKAAGELADRLRQSMPELSTTGREVTVTTYHGFAYSILDELGAVVGMERGTAVIGPGFQRQLIDEALATGTYGELDLTWPAGQVAYAATLARQLGDNLLSVDALMAAAPDDLDPIWARRAELAAVARRYAEIKTRLGVVDYADLIRLAHRVVSELPELAERIRSRYRVVLLDEYQDTDPAQRELMLAIFGGGFPLTAVGDTDQTIYEWRGASLENFEGFPTHFPAADGSPAETLPLTLNRRSDRLILDLANRIRSEVHGGDSFDLLRPVEGAATGSIESAWLRTETDEAAWIADRIVETGAPWRQIAVLFRKSKHIGPVRNALLAAGVPVQVVSLGGLLEVPEVAELHAWLRILHDPEDSAALARILLGSTFRLGMGDLARLAAWVRERRGYDDQEAGPPLALLEAIEEMESVQGISDEARRRLLRFRDLYRDLLVTAQGESLVELSRRILGALEAWTEIDAMEEHAALSARLNIYRFLDLTESWSPLEGRPSLGAFLGYLELLSDERAVDELDTATVSSEQAVSLLTVHRAKGLEWDTVILPAVVKDTFPSRSLGYDDPVEYPQFVPYALRIDAERLAPLEGAPDARSRRDVLGRLHRAAEWRTAYVAVTRARHRLIVTGSFWSDGRTPRAPSHLWDLAAGLAERSHLVDEPGERPSVTAVAPGPGPDPLFGDGGWPAALRAALVDEHWLDAYPEHVEHARRSAEQLRLTLDALPEPQPPAPKAPPATSVTGLVTLARCPRRFMWSAIDRLPVRPSNALRRGVHFHRRVELHNLGKVPLTDLDEDPYDLGDDAPLGPPPRDPFDVFLESRLADQRPRLAETPIEIRTGGLRILGRIDAVYEVEPGTWEIVDYKSGRRSDDAALDVQLQAYAVAAVDGAVAVERPEQLTVTFAYFGGAEYEERSIDADAAWLDAARDRIDSLAAIVARGDFPPTPSEACVGCDFLPFCTAGQDFVADVDGQHS